MTATAASFSADDEAQILAAIAAWLDTQVRPQVKHFDHADEYPQAPSSA